jgi:outer membrane lipoprotein LolB
MRISALRIGAVAVGAALTALAGCRTVPVSFPVAPPWEVRRPQLQGREHFGLQGRVAVANGNEGFNASLHWMQDGEQSRLTLEGPFGAGGVQITASGSDLNIVSAHGQPLDAAAAHAELSARLGFDPPLSSLRFWILGVPDPTLPATETLDGTQHRLKALTQSGWRIDYPAYSAFGAESLPVRMTLQRAALRVRLLVDDWQF